MFAMLNWLIALCLAPVILILVGLWIKQRRVNKYIEKFPGPSPHFLWGNLARNVKEFYKEGPIPRHVYMLQRTCAQAHLFDKQRIFRLWLSWKPVIALFKPETVEVLLSSPTFIDKSWDYSLLHPWLGTGLLTSTGNKWRSRRKMLTPAFHFRILEDFLPIVHEQSSVFVQKIREYTDKEYVDIFSLVTLCTLDIICETAMGVQLGAQTNGSSTYVKAVYEAGSSFLHRNMRPWLWNDFLYGLLPSGRQCRKMLNIMHDFTRQVIRERKKYFEEKAKSHEQSTHAKDLEIEGTKKKRAFLDLLLDYQVNNPSLTEEDIREEVDTFMFEGHDTTAMGITWALYCIGLYPDVQRKVHEELDSIFGSDAQQQVTPQHVADMKYLECVLKEAQRLYPSVPMFGRQLQDDLDIGELTVPKGSSCFVFTYMLHRNPEVFPNPEVFDPDRFLPENSRGRHPYAYIPFSAGPRNCIGQKFAMMEEKVVVSTVLRHYNVRSLDPRDKLLFTSELTLRPVGEVRLKLTERGQRSADD